MEEVKRMEDILPILQHLNSFSCKGVLATIINVDGSSYKKEGSSMLICEDGHMVGLISAGCLEADLQLKAVEVIKEGVPKVITYDMKDENGIDLFWGNGSGCNGTIQVLLEPLTQTLKKDLFVLKDYLDKGEKVFSIKRFTKDYRLVDYNYITETKMVFGSHDKSDEVDFYQNFTEEKSGLRNTMNGFIHFVHHYKPKPKLYLFGAGPDAKPVVNLAKETGFHVTLCDWRPALCNKEKFPNADHFVVGFPRELFSMIKLEQNDFIILMTHHFQKDKEILSFLLPNRYRYLGILGPRARTEKLFQGDHVPSEIFSPIGLSIGAQGAEEIAVSILAELIQILRKPIKVEV